MNNPNLYTSVNDLQKRDAQVVLDSVKSVLPWKDREEVLDVGCGPGDLTVSILKPYLPKNSHLIGCDISESMVKYAQSTYGNDLVTFKQLDIGNSNIWMNWDEESFDKIFSFYCLNWVNDQKQAAQNMNALLKDDGHLVTMFTIQHPFLDFFQYLATQSKWSSYKRVWNTWDVFYTGKDPKEEYIKVLKSCDFDVKSSNTRKLKFSHPTVQDFICYFESVNPFVKKVPSSETESFLEECTQEMLNQGLITKNNDGGITHEYVVLITHAKKSEK